MELGDAARARVARVGAVDLDIHDRFAPLASSQSGSIAGQAALLVALDADHRVEQAVDDQAARGDRAGDRIDQEGHVVIDDADPHPALAELAAERFQPDQRDAGRPALGAAGDEARRPRGILVGEVVELAGQRAVDQRTR